MFRKFLLLLATLVAALVGANYALPDQTREAFVGMGHTLAGVEVKHAGVAGFDIEYYDSGPRGDAEPLVLIHGFGGDKENFTGVAAMLRDYRVIALDLPGFGASSKPAAASYAIETQVERVRALLQALGLKRVHLGGSSMGGWIAGVYAARYPDEVASLWFLGTAMIARAEPSEMQKMIEAGQPVPLLVKTEADFEPLLDFVMNKRLPMPGAIKHFLARRAVQDYALHKQIMEEISRFNPDNDPRLDAYVKNLATPALVVWGEQDRVLHHSGATILDELMPNAEVILMPGIGHLPMLEDPWTTSRDYISFRSRLKNGGKSA